MDEIESELQTAAGEVLTGLRQGRGLDEEASKRLTRVLRAAAQEWATSDVVSKSAANLFVDLGTAIEACGYSYAGTEATRIRALADEVTQLVRSCVAV